jgi:hypothetical protein
MADATMRDAHPDLSRSRIGDVDAVDDQRGTRGLEQSSLHLDLITRRRAVLLARGTGAAT